MDFLARFRKPKLRLFELKYVLKPKYCHCCGQMTTTPHLRVLAANEEDAILMRRYLVDEGFEG